MSRALLLLVTLSLLCISSVIGGDRCANFLSGCDECVAEAGCGWCSWGQGSCMSGVSSGPTSTVCHERSATSASNWYFGTCSDQCYLVCGISCTSSQNCEINRDADPPECSCVVKQGIIIGAVAGSIFLFCLLLTIFVCIRRRNALKHSKQLNVDFEYNNGPASYTTLPGGQPAHVVGYTGSYAPASLTGSTQ